MRALAHVKVGDVLKVTFLDHAAHSGPASGVLEFEAYGKVTDVGKAYVTITSWLGAKAKRVDGDSESFSILKSAITDVRRLR